MEDKIAAAAEAIKKSKRAIAFTGAGISVESGIPPFRGKGGLWTKYDSKVLSIDAFYHDPAKAWVDIKKIFYDFFGEAKPNPAHKALAELEKRGLIKAVITQNIDNLHQEAGSKEVIEFHGTCSTMVCISCGKKFKSETVNLNTLPPHCDCGGVLKPDFVFFGEGIPEDAFKTAFDYAHNTDLVLVIGTTGEVVPANFIPQDAKRRNATIIEINPSESNYTYNVTDIYIKEKAGIALPKILEKLDE